MGEIVFVAYVYVCKEAEGSKVLYFLLKFTGIIRRFAVIYQVHEPFLQAFKFHTYLSSD